jgi:galactokinase
VSQLPLDVQEFIDRLRAGPDPFVDGRALTVGRAPGRLDVMGGIADYSGALVLQWPIRESTRVAVQFQPSPYLQIVSVRPGGQPSRVPQPSTPGNQSDSRQSSVQLPLSLITAAAPPYSDLRAWFAAHPDGAWAAYVAGVFAVLAGERGVRMPDGAAVLVESEVPEGKGVSSSAALEAATMIAVGGALALQIPEREMAMLCQRAENVVVGAPCGVMDQMASICGQEGALMALLCQPAELQGARALPANLGVWGVDSGIRHAVSGADYMSVRVGAFIGYRIIAELAGLRVGPGPRAGQVQVVDPRWGGYLANVGVDAFQQFEADLPPSIAGDAFLERYGGTTDPVTTVDPAREYSVRVPTAHPIHEHRRVSEFAESLSDRADAEMPLETTARLGALMFESHASYSACGLGSDGTDLLVELARDAGPAAGVYGAKITGGGSGGTVALLADAAAGDVVRRIAADYASRTGRDAYVFQGSSPGAATVGPIRVSFG